MTGEAERHAERCATVEGIFAEALDGTLALLSSATLVLMRGELEQSAPAEAEFALDAIEVVLAQRE